ncbi:sucrase ferredoxin [Planctomonas psychrotolerans]|uniref:sucrase ferredoxin n=1 Tax=Planctomonas psychrotolerans TaxID=2528712 RepID=UPI00123C7622|nr:sucrase ferredoxin [Planctomonas psychrotolerans]
MTPSSEGWRPCSDRSEERQDPLTGTAGYGERWFLVEIDGAWGTHAFLQSRLDPALGRRLVRRVEGEGMRPLAIRRTGRRADERRHQSRWRWAYVDARPGREEVRWGSVDDPEKLLEVPLDGTAGEPSTQPVVCVCTHARHDQCCAVKGRPVVSALAKALPEHTWECSHLGGDRFAATMIVFPHGLYYGRVLPEHAEDVVDRSRTGTIDARYFRGRSALPNVVQAAQGYARSASHDYRIDSFHPVSSSKDGDLWTVVLDHDGTAVTVCLAESLSEPMLSTCSASRAAPVRQFVLTSIATAA